MDCVIAVLSDIHSNLHALSAVWRRIDELGLEPEAREAYLHRTARGVFGLDRS